MEGGAGRRRRGRGAAAERGSSFLARFQDRISVVSRDGSLKQQQQQQQQQQQLQRVRDPGQRTQRMPSSSTSTRPTLADLDRMLSTTSRAPLSPLTRAGTYRREGRAPARFREMEYLAAADPGRHRGVDERRARNEARVRSAADQLHFSRKARAVAFKPKTLKAYRALNAGGYQELGRLKPDLQSEELRAKREAREKVVAYSRRVWMKNKAEEATESTARETKLVRARQKAKKRRERAIRYAKGVPKPRPAPSSSVESSAVASRGRARHRRQRESPDELSGETELERLEREHDSYAAQVEAIRRELQDS